MTEPGPAIGARNRLARLLSPGGTSATGRILRGAAVVGGVSLLVKLVAFGKEMAVAASFGRGDVLEAFLVALLFPTLIAGIVGGAFHQAFVPIYVRVRARSPGEADALFRHALKSASWVLLGAAALLYLAAPVLLGAVAGGYAPEKLALSIWLLRFLTPLCLLAALPGMLSAALHARERYLVPSLAQVSFPGLTLCLLAVFGSELGAIPLVVGAVGGYGIEAVVLILTLVRTGGITRARAAVPTEDFRAVVGQWLPAAGGMVIQNAMTLVDQAMAAHLVAGSVASLSYAYRVIALPLSLGTLSVGTALLPVLSDLAARDEWDGFWRTMRRFAGFSLWGGLIPVAALTLLAGPLIGLIYQRGSFDTADTAAVTTVFVAYAGMIPFYVAGIIGVRGLTILGLNRALLVISVVNLTANVVGNVVLARWFGVSGIAMSTVIVYILSATLIFGTLQRHRLRATRP